MPGNLIPLTPFQTKPGDKDWSRFTTSSGLVVQKVLSGPSNFLERLIRPHRKKIYLALLLNIFVGVAIAFQNVVPKFLIDDALLKEGLSVDQRKVRVVLLAFLYVFVGVFARAFVWNASLRVFSRVRETCVFNLRSLFFRHVNHLCLNFHARHQSGELFSFLLGSPLQQIQQYYQQLAMLLPSSVVGIVVTLAFLGLWDLYLSILTLLILVAYGYVIQRARLKMVAIHRDYQNAESQVSGKVSDLLRGYRTVKMHAFEDHALEDFQSGAGILRDKSYRRDIATHIENIKQEAVLYSGFALLCIGAGWRYLSGDLTEGQLTAYLTSFISLQGPLGLIFQIALLRGGAQASLQRIGQVLETGSSIPDPEFTPATVPSNGDIRLQSVSFRYDENPALTDIDLTLPYGQNVALVGSSGAGKSTLVQLILRLYDPNEGSIRIGGIDLRQTDGKELRKRFGVVPQDPYFFHTTLRENLRIAAPNADDATLLQACREANAWEFIERLPEGLDSIIGEGGTTLSGGQKQRLAIARAVLSNPSYFIFDEATSALDTVSEGLIRDAIARITRQRTSIFIAHRLASITHCERILVFEAGRLVQDGDFSTLAATSGPFQKLLQTQNLPEHPSA